MTFEGEHTCNSSNIRLMLRGIRRLALMGNPFGVH